MAGNTARIDRQTLRVQWDSYVPMASICQFWTITSHQLIRLREAWSFPPRLDRKKRHKPSRQDRLLDPSPEEIEASESSLSLAPSVASRVTVVQATWTIADREERLACKPTPFALMKIDLPLEITEEEGEW